MCVRLCGFVLIQKKIVDTNENLSNGYGSQPLQTCLVTGNENASKLFSHPVLNV